MGHHLSSLGKASLLSLKSWTSIKISLTFNLEPRSTPIIQWQGFPTGIYISIYSFCFTRNSGDWQDSQAGILFVALWVKEPYLSIQFFLRKPLWKNQILLWQEYQILLWHSKLGFGISSLTGPTSLPEKESRLVPLWERVMHCGETNFGIDFYLPRFFSCEGWTLFFRGHLCHQNVAHGAEGAKACWWGSAKPTVAVLRKGHRFFLVDESDGFIKGVQ